MIRNELDKLERFVDELVKYLSVRQTEVSSERQEELLRSIVAACGNIRRKWSERLFSQIKDQTVKRYIHFHQTGLIRLSDKLHDHLIRPDGGQIADDQTIQAQECLDALFQFLEHAFPDHFDQDLVISRYRRLLEHRKLSGLTDLLERDFQRMLPNSALTKEIIRSLQRAIADLPVEPVTSLRLLTIYHSIVSFRHYIAETKLADETGLFLLALKINFNAKGVISWFKEQTVDPGILDLQDIAGIVEPLNIEDHPPLEPLGTSLRDSLLFRVDGTLQLPSIAKAAITLPPQMPLTLSVTQLALFIRVCYRNGCFPLQNAAAIIRFFTAHFTTKRQGNISIKSFTKGFYADDQTAAAVIRDLLHRMIAFITKTYFP